MKNSKIRLTAEYGLLVALAFILSYLESLIPAFFAIPGMKVGLTNLVVMFALYRMGEKSAIAINFVRIILVSLTFSGFVGLAYSLAGGCLSALLMIVFKKTGKFSVITVSVIGGISHNIGQIIVAMFLMQTRAVGYYLVILWFTGIASGLVIGVIASAIIKRVGADGDIVL